MFKKYLALTLIGFILSQSIYAGTEKLEINGTPYISLIFMSFNEVYGGWSDIRYKNTENAFDIYTVPIKRKPSEEGVVANSDSSLLSPDKKYLIIQRTNAGEVINEDGNSIITSQAYCDVMLLDTGCIKNIGSVQQCDGGWENFKWRVTTGEIYDFSKIGITPKRLVSDTSMISEVELRANSIRDSVFMGSASYMACYSPEHNIPEYNDIAFYLAQGGEHLLAMQFYNYLLNIAAKRAPLNLNVADSLWVLGRFNDAIKYYEKYRSLMIEKGMTKKLPKRVMDRIAQKGTDLFSAHQSASK